ncbi:cotton fiber protein [Thalictrum thalictroides]|uniref:Cotton fiber protein n=1 Tax=Thalictrum thalictroides TaxID=46969 RepID=A0A7J6V3Q8_THATH|nr:cotton fiber protein [Thalictrum thalictroides]
MGKIKKTGLSRRAWNLLRIALLWARKGGALRRGLMVELRLLPNYIKNLRHVDARESIHYREKEFSFDETPLFNFKMHRPSSLRFHMPSLPCIKPQVDFDYEFNDDDDEDTTSVYYQEGRKSYLTQKSFCSGNDDEDDRLQNGEIIPVEDEAIDLKAEEFIANFYKQMKMQRQISYLQYEQTLSKGSD